MVSFDFYLNSIWGNSKINENPDFKEVEEKQDYFARLLKTCGATIDSDGECIRTGFPSEGAQIEKCVKKYVKDVKMRKFPSWKNTYK